jgi:ubiquinone biosynthesis protein
LRIQRRLKGVARFRQIAVVLAKYGFGEVLARANLPFRVKALLRRPIAARPAGPVGLRMALEELGPAFVKFGQILSTRSYLLPPEYAVELAKLQDQVSPFSFEEVEGVIQAELGAKPLDIFAEFETQPLASASIAQVHLARLKTGERVCVKVQRPQVRETLALDIMILKELARLLEAHVPESRQYDPTGVVGEFERTSRREVDFSIEAINIEVFGRNFADDPSVSILRVFKGQSSSRVLTTEFIDGIKISDVDSLRAANLDTVSVAKAGAHAVLRQVFEFGFFHADPHPGNIFVKADGKIAPVDFGIVGRLSRDEVRNLAELLIGIVQNESESLLSGMERLHLLPDDVNRRDVLEEVMLLGEKYGGLTLGEINFKELFGEVLAFMRRYRIRMRTEFLLLGKALSIYEEVGRVLDPEFSMMAEARPYVTKLMRRKRLLTALLGSRGKSLTDNLSKLSTIPSDVAHVLALAREGRLKIEFEHLGLEKLTAEIEKASNRISFSFITAALVVASSLILVLGGKVIYYRTFGIVGFVLAAMVGVWLLFNIIRSGRV